MRTDPTDTFRQEARELLEQLEQALLDLGQRPADHELVDTAFRALHTLKGSGSMFGFDAVAAFVHDFETAFDLVRKGAAPISADLISIALSAKDHVSSLIMTPGGGRDAEGDAILARLRGSVQGLAPDMAAAPAPDAAGAPDWHLAFRLPPDALALGTNPVLLLDDLRSLGDCSVSADSDDVPELEQLDPTRCYLAWEVRLKTPASREAIEDVFIFLRDDMEFSLSRLGAPSAAEPEAAEAGSPVTAAAIGEPPEAHPSVARPGVDTTSLRVSAERLDELMDRVGELVIAQARLSQLATGSHDGALKTVAEEIERLAAGLRDTTMSVRMLAIGTLFGRFRRLVHDLSATLGKQVEFVTSGEETELDKTMIERLADPLVHIIRNAVDHGLEQAASREAAGKSRRGQVRLAAAHTGAEVVISISDDGAGLDLERIRAKAEQAGLIAPGANLPARELRQFIFHPGFSTATEVTSVSGRGVGMDVVKRTIDGLRGSIEVDSVPGEGTTVRLRLPLTLAIIEGMLVRVGRGRYSIPLSAVEECVELPPDAIASSSSGRNFLSIRGKLVPFLRLRELFQVSASEEPFPKVVIVSAGEHRVGLVVDQILGNSQTVIKSLSKLHATVQEFSGATILGDGTVALILDVPHLVRCGQTLEGRLRAPQTGRAA